MKVIQSRENPQFKGLVKLASSSRERRRAGSTIIEGEHLVRAYLESGGVAETVLASESAVARPGIRELVEAAPANSYLVLADALLARISQLVSAAGVAAVIRTPQPGPLPQTAVDCVLLEDLQDPGNVGSILRTAVAAGLRHVLLSRDSVFAWAPKVVRAGMGAHFSLSIFQDIDQREFARGFGGLVVATELRAEASLYDLDLRGPVAWIFGNEGAGLSEKVASIAARRVRIPMPGPAESMNVAAAVAVCLFEQVRQRAAS